MVKIVRNKPRRIVIKRSIPLDGFWHVHAHSRFSVKDAISPVEQMVETAVRHGQKALALTDHGSMGGAVQLYKECSKAGIAPFPGVEIYLVQDKVDKKAKRYHAGMVAFTTEGYSNLCKIQSHANTRESFHHKPLIDLNDFAEFKEQGLNQGIALTTGCYFGLAIQMLVHEGYESAKRIVKMYANYFPNTYVELQNHNIDHGDGWNDWKVTEYMLMIAGELGLPVVVAQDAHYCEQDEQPLHNQLKQLIAYGPDPDDAKFPGDGFHLSDEQWVKDHHGKLQWEAGVEGLLDLYSKHNLVIPELEKYHFNIPTTVPDPYQEVYGVCHAQLIMRGLDKKRYLNRLDDEMEVIKASNMAGYLWLVKEVCDWCNDHQIFNAARGSASGSLVCWLLGITQADPLKYGLRFDRFLSKDRTKPPDIDVDVEPTRREEIVEWLKKRFNVCQIGTYSVYGLNEDEEGGGGSLLVSYQSKLRKMEKFEELKGLKALDDVPEPDRSQLQALADLNIYSQYGTHAGGFVLTSTSEEFDRLVPTMLIASSNTTVTQYGKDDVEDLGFVKLDLLGNRNLTTLRLATELLGRDVSEGFDWIPLDDPASYKMLRKGHTTGIFQMEGYTATRGNKEMKTSSFKDIVHILAIYRPGVMNSGGKDAYIRRKFKMEEVTYLHPLLEKHFKETYGIPIFQEQTVGLLRELGFDAENLTKFLKAVKASNKDIGGAGKVIAGYRDLFVELAEKAGFSQEAIDWTWEAIEGFAEYGFNKAHAVSYALTSARLAYIKANHPLEFAVGLLQSAWKDKKITDYVGHVRKHMKIPILKPEINISNQTYAIDRKRQAVRKGFATIKGIGHKAADALVEVREEYGEFTSVADLCEKAIKAGHTRTITGVKSFEKEGYKGTLKHLYDAGALDGIRDKEKGE